MFLNTLKAAVSLVTPWAYTSAQVTLSCWRVTAWGWATCDEAPGDQRGSERFPPTTGPCGSPRILAAPEMPVEQTQNHHTYTDRTQHLHQINNNNIQINIIAGQIIFYAAMDYYLRFIILSKINIFFIMIYSFLIK